MTTDQKFSKLERTNRHWRWLAGALGLVLAAMFVLPLGLAVAQDNDTDEKPQAEADRPNPRVPYLQRIQEIEAAVKAGKMSRKDGDRAMIETRQAMEELARRSGVTERNHDEGLVGHYKRMGVSIETLGAFKKVLADTGVTDRQMESALGGMLRVIHEMKTEGDNYEMDPGMAQYLKDNLGLTSKQIELVEGIAVRIFHGMKDSDSKLEPVRSLP